MGVIIYAGYNVPWISYFIPHIIMSHFANGYMFMIQILIKYDSVLIDDQVESQICTYHICGTGKIVTTLDTKIPSKIESRFLRRFDY